MRLACIELDGQARAAMVTDDGLIDLTAQAGVKPEDIPRLLIADAEVRSRLQAALNSATTRLPHERIVYRSPVLRPRKIFGVGLNYHSFVEAARAAGMTVPNERLWFLRPSACLAGAHAEVRLPCDADDLDYEAEMAVVIGRPARFVSVSQAPSVIGGFTVGNDLTLRKRAAKSLALGKCFDTHTPLGPWITTPDDVGDPHNLVVEARVNGELRQSSNTSDMIANCYELIAELSTYCTLEPGDVILTGTPNGSAIFHSPARMLQAGDEVRIEVEGLGAIENLIVGELREG